MEKRYWDLPWFHKAWRHIHWVKLPYYVLTLWRRGMPIRIALAISQGLIDADMERWYTLDEVKDRLEHKINIRDK